MNGRPRKPPTRPLVLVVDDDDDTRELYVQSFVLFGFGAIGAGDCDEAHRRAWDDHPDIVVTDLTLRDGDGWQLVQDLEARAANATHTGRPTRRPRGSIIARARRT
jgi:DNA-binding response OmpR family regulator